jgi:hypothetical protein
MFPHANAARCSYNEAWDALCGTVIKRIIVDDKKRKHTAVAAAD